MVRGRAVANLTAPIYGDEDRALDRSIELTVLVMNRIGRFRGGDAKAEILKAAREAPYAELRSPAKGDKPEILIVVEAFGVKGKGRVELTGSSTPRDGVSGTYEGKDVLGAAEWIFEGNLGQGNAPAEGVPGRDPRRGVERDRRNGIRRPLRRRDRYLGATSAGRPVLPRRTAHPLPPRPGGRDPGRRAEGGAETVGDADGEEEPDRRGRRERDRGRLPVPRRDGAPGRRPPPGVEVSTGTASSRPRRRAPWSRHRNGRGRTGPRGRSTGPRRCAAGDMQQTGTVKNRDVTVTYAGPRGKGEVTCNIGLLKAASLLLVVEKPGVDRAVFPLRVGSLNGTITGTVLLENVPPRGPGAAARFPLADAVVKLDGDPKVLKWAAVDAGRTDAKGRFRIRMRMANWERWDKAFEKPLVVRASPTFLHRLSQCRQAPRPVAGLVGGAASRSGDSSTVRRRSWRP